MQENECSAYQEQSKKAPLHGTAHVWPRSSMVECPPTERKVASSILVVVNFFAQNSLLLLLNCKKHVTGQKF